MKNTYLKRTICTALAGLMMAMTACGNVTEERESPASTSKDTTSSANNEEPTTTSGETSDEPVNKLSVEPLSSVKLEKNETQPDDEFNSSYKDYAAEFFKTTCAEDIKAGKNVMVSPESVMMALGMTANGAKGETLSQMETALG